MKILTLIASFILAAFFLMMAISAIDECFSLYNLLGASGLYAMYRIKAIRDAIEWLNDMIIGEE